MLSHQVIGTMHQIWDGGLVLLDHTANIVQHALVLKEVFPPAVILLGKMAINHWDGLQYKICA